MPAGISCWRVRNGLCSQGEVTAMLPGSEQGMERGLGSPECAGCPLTFLSVQGHSPECATISCPACGHSSSPCTPPPSPRPLLTPHTTRRGTRRLGMPGEAGASPGSRRDAGVRRMLQKDALWEGCSAEQRPSGASRCRPPSLINYSRVAPNRFHLKSSKAGGRRKAVPDKGGRFDTH